MQYTADFIKALTSPDRRYGEVPFYWWNGGELTKERLTAQLEALAEKGLAGVQVNYCHINEGGEEGLPYGGFGRSLAGTPPQFSDEWWELFYHAAKECERLGMSIGMGDYTIAWIGNGYFTDKVAAAEGMNAVNLSCEEKMLFSGDEDTIPQNTLAVISYEDSECKKPVVIFEKGKGVLNPVKGLCKAYIITETRKENSIDPLNPLCGSLLVDLYFREFERRCPDLKPGTLNYFFQDELMFGTGTRYLWNETLREAVKEKRGYDILGFLPHLFFNLSDYTPVIRLDCQDVKTALIEENYFIPVYNFHAERGLTYGCDQASRGKEPDEFSDYFRTVRWFTAPGNDTPGRAADLIKVKVNSSIAHLYKRPRVWLEGYHSSGWGTTLESITAPTSDNFIYGANLLNLHGLYYGTNGGFFEWAPPDFHFRMPYWDDEKAWLDKYKRMSALLTTGVHRCDAAIFYPVSSCDYGENHKTCIDATFGMAEHIFNNGIDFDFIDFQSVENSVCENGLMKVSDEQYKVLIFAGVDAIRQSVIDKAEEFLKNGGTVIFSGITPYISDKYGAGSAKFKEQLDRMLSHKSCYLTSNEEGALTVINKSIKRSFITDIASGITKAFVHTRVHGDSKLFFVRYVKKDSVCRFEATGKTYLFDTDKGEVILLSGTVERDGFTYIKMPLEAEDDTLILFTEEDIPCDRELNIAIPVKESIAEEIILDGEWDFHIIPTLDNTFGDYYIPAGGIIGAEGRFFDVTAVRSTSHIPGKPDFTDIPFCTSRAIGRISVKSNKKALIKYLSENSELMTADALVFEGEEYKIERTALHDRYGFHSYEYSPSLYEQGHHGLKGRVYDDNLIFSDDCIFFTYIYSPEDTDAVLRIGNIQPEFIILNSDEVSEGRIRLHKGKNLLFAALNFDEAEIPDYRNSSYLKRTSLYITKEEIEETDYPLSITPFANSTYYGFSGNCEENGLFRFEFDSVPSLEKLEFSLFGELVAAYNNEEKLDFSENGTGNFGSKKYSAEVKNVTPYVSRVVFFVKSTDGKEYTSLVPEPVRLFCGKGKMTAGDLCKTGALKSFSGKAVYEKDITLSKIYTDRRFYLDISDASATVNVEINGKPAVVFTYRPFTADITDFIRNGENHIKITVSSTLCNHYSTVPSKYSNFPEDSKWGLTGEVKITVKEREI